MTALFTKRLVKSVIQLFVVSVMTFLLLALSPGDAATTILGRYATPDAVAALRTQLHLDQPVVVQYVRWLGDMLRGDFGTSLLTGEPISNQIANRIVPTFTIVLLSVIIVGILGLALGIWSGLKGGAVARLVDALGLLGVGVPGFIIALGLIVVFSTDLGWFPPEGFVPFTSGVGSWAAALVLPVAALVVGGVGFISKQVRASLLDAMTGGYVRTMTANGFSPASIVLRHALRNAAIPVLSVLGVALVGLLGGSVLIEQVFGIPGLGGMAVNAATTKDLPAVQAVAVIYTLIIIVVNLALDVIYVALNPKVRIA